MLEVHLVDRSRLTSTWRDDPIFAPPGGDRPVIFRVQYISLTPGSGRPGIMYSTLDGRRSIQGIGELIRLGA